LPLFSGLQVCFFNECVELLRKWAFITTENIEDKVQYTSSVDQQRSQTKNCVLTLWPHPSNKNTPCQGKDEWWWMFNMIRGGLAMHHYMALVPIQNHVSTRTNH
jgi:hypothetical protein